MVNFVAGKYYIFQYLSKNSLSLFVSMGFVFMQLSGLLIPAETHAFNTVSASATITTGNSQIIRDSRVTALKKYLENKNSPMSDYSQDFIYWADEYDLDWRLLPAIAGVESSFGKRIPVGSYNAYGWANGKYLFSSWENGIETVAKTLSQKYVSKGKNTVSEIAKWYCPPNPLWAVKVRFFMNQIDSFPLTFDY